MRNKCLQHKLEVFISSKMDEKYNIARKAIKTAIEATGLANVYIYEDEPASSQDAVYAYLSQVDKSDLAIFLIDNKDDAPDPVKQEISRARENNIRQIYLFCDEKEKEKTIVQQELNENHSAKYLTVHEFSDFVDNAYYSFLQDIITIYRDKTIYYDTESTNLEKAATNNMLFVMKDLSFPATQKTLCENILNLFKRENDVAPEQLDLDLSKLLEFILGKVSISEVPFQRIKELILNEHDHLAPIISKRIDAQILYYQNKYEKALDLLKDAIANALEDTEIPTWIVNDIAIDIRHVQSCIDHDKGTYTFNEYGQKIINDSKEPLFYPLIDRHEKDLYHQLSKEYFEHINMSPYTTRYGSIQNIFESIVKIFCTSQLYGSIVHTLLTADRMILSLEYLTTMYNDRSMLFEYLRLLIVKNDLKRLKNVTRTYSEAPDILDNDDIQSIINSTKNLNNAEKQLKANLLIGAFFGYYMNDDSYLKLSEDLFVNITNYISNNTLLINIWEYIKIFLTQTNYRIDIKKVIELLELIQSRNYIGYYNDCVSIIYSLSYLDFSKVNDEVQKRIFDLLEHFSSEPENIVNSFQLRRCISIICLRATININNLNAIVETHWPDYYVQDHELTLSDKHGTSPLNHIERLISDAENNNKIQGQNGAYLRMVNEPLDIIFRILTQCEKKASQNMIKKIVNISEETLASVHQTVSSKISAVKLLSYIIPEYANIPFIQLKNRIIKKQEIYSSGAEFGFGSKDSNNLLDIFYSFLIYQCNSSDSNIFIQKLFSLDANDSYDIICILEFLSEYFEIRKNYIPDDSLMDAFLYFSIAQSSHKEKNVKYYSSLLLTKLAKYERTTKLSLITLSKIMNMGNPSARTAIISEIKDLDKNNKYVKEILNKGCNDNNYLVRLASMNID